MAQHGLGLLEEQLSSDGLLELGAHPSTDDVHNASTTVAELPPHLLESLKELGGAPPMPPRPPIAAPSPHEHAEIFDLVARLDVDEPETLLLDTALLDSLPPLPMLVTDETPPQTIELHVIRESGPLAAVETELARLPRPVVIAGALVASVSLAGVMAVLCWTLIHLVF